MKHTLKSLEITNFKTFGAKKTILALDDHSGFTLVMGKNLDNEDEESRNGCGKSSIFEALCYVMTGKSIKEGRLNLVNIINEKNMLVALEGQLGDYDYRIERGMKPSVCRFYKKLSTDDSDITEHNVTRDSMSNTQADITKFFRGLTDNLFRFIMVSSTKTPTFFNLKSEDQKQVIEQLFGFEILTLKAEAIKKDRQQLETELTLLRARIEEKLAFKRKIEEKIKVATERHKSFEDTRLSTIKSLETTLENLSNIDLDQQREIIEAISEFEKVYNDDKLKYQYELKSVQDSISALDRRITTAKSKITLANQFIKKYEGADAASAIEKFDEISKAEQDKLDVLRDKKTIQSVIQELSSQKPKLKKEIENITDNCPTCGQTWPDHDKIELHKENLNTQLQEIEDRLKEEQDKITLLDIGISELDLIIKDKPKDFSSRDEAVQLDGKLERYNDELKEASKEVHQLEGERVDLIQSKDTLEAPVLSDDVKALKEILQVKTISEIDNILLKIKNTNEKIAEQKDAVNPYEEQLKELDEDQEEIDMDDIVNMENNITNHKDMEKYLTRKDSPIRRSITNVRLPQLNKFVSERLDKLGLRYKVVFNDDLSASIHYFDKELNFADVSSGEEERIGMALSWAFRDLFEAMHYEINFYAIDERLDAGVDASGVERAVEVLYEMAHIDKKNIFLVSHRKDIIDHASRIIVIERKGHFSEVVIK